MLVVGANLAIDRTLRLDELRPGHVQRPRSAQITAGGKAVNVCRACVAHGVRPRLVANLPGVLGAFVGDLLDAEGHDVRRVATGGEIRTATIVLDDVPRTTVLNEPGPDLDADDRAALLAAVLDELGGHGVLLMSGSLPPGTPQDLYGEITDAARARGVTVVVDAAREALVSTLAHRPDVVTPNLDEARSALAMREHGAAPSAVEGIDPDPATARRDAVEAARRLRRHGPAAVLVTAGSHGVAGADADGAFWAGAPSVPLVNPIGAGDCFAAGLAVALEKGRPLREAVLVAVASGSASVTTPLAGEVDAALMNELLVRLVLQEVTA